MIFREVELRGVFVIELERLEDERGFFARTWCREELEARGLVARIAQCSIAWNEMKGTLRGMHYQADPHGETKIVRCTRGAAHDVLVDLRPASATFRRWIAVELDEDHRRMVYVPEGVAHGYQTLVDGTELEYQISEPYAPASARGVRWDDPAFGIEWPPGERIISARDRSFPDFVP